MRIAVVGASGRMGQEIQQVLFTLKDKIEFIGVTRKGKAPGYSNSVTNISAIKGKLDVIIDFSLPDNTSEVVRFCDKRKVSLVSGVTGLSDEQMGKLVKLSKKLPVLWSSNMSLGIAQLKKAISSISGLEDYDVQMVEWHHRHKKDKPSGTAKSLQAELNKLKTKSTVAPLSVRGGGIVGVHKVYLMSEQEVLCFEHQALSRSVFASGAIKAALWIVKKGPGLYSMEDVLVQSKNGPKSK